MREPGLHGQRTKLHAFVNAASREVATGVAISATGDPSATAGHLVRRSSCCRGGTTPTRRIVVKTMRHPKRSPGDGQVDVHDTRRMNDLGDGGYHVVKVVCLQHSITVSPDVGVAANRPLAPMHHGVELCHQATTRVAAF